MAVMAENAAARKQFREGWQAVPADAFLAWAPSMLSLLDEDVGDALLPLLQASFDARHRRLQEAVTSDIRDATLVSVSYIRPIMFEHHACCAL